MDPRSTKTTRRFSSARRDVVVVVAVSVVISTVLPKLNLSEALFAWTRPLERFQLDELPFVLLVIAICLVCAVIQNVDRVYGVVTGLIRQLRPVVLDDLGLNAALQQCVADWCRRLPKTVIVLTIGADIDDLDESQSLVLFRLVQEALTDMARHSHANHVDVKIGRERAPESTAEAIVISIADDGIGTDLTRQRTGLGLLGMSERLATIGGLLTILSAPGKGFTVSALVPVVPAALRE
jgi:signal transduction histidine kinase